MKAGFGAVCAALVTFAGLFTSGCGSGSSPNVTVTITSPSSAQRIEAGQTVNITASVTSDGAAAMTNVNWSVSGSDCSGSACGTLMNQTGTSVTYQAPPLVAANANISVIATSAADRSKSASISITVFAITVEINNKVSELAAALNPSGSLFALFTATPIADPQNQGVTWTLSANGTACSPVCGTLSTVDNLSAQYTPPATVPTAPDDTPTITATSITDATKSDSDSFKIFDGTTACGAGGNERELNGEYAVMLQGWQEQTNPVNGSSRGFPILTAVSFGADGTGKITAGQGTFDHLSGSFGAIVPTASGYSVGPDNRGCLTLTDSAEQTFTFQFSVGSVVAGVVSRGNIVEFDKQSTQPARASGILRRQDPGAFSLDSLAPAHAIGIAGWYGSPALSMSRFAVAGSFALNGGTISSPWLDANDGGSLSSLTEAGVNLGSIGAISSGTGMAFATIYFPGITPTGSNATIFVINSSELFVVVDSGIGSGGPLILAGEAIATSPSLTPAAIAPSYIFRSTGSSAGVASTSIGLLNFSGGGLSGTVSGKVDSYAVGAAGIQTVSGTYAFTPAAGRLSITGANSATSPICYLPSPFDNIAAFCVSTDSAASLGVMDTQPAATYGNNSLSENFFFGSGEPDDDTVPGVSGVAAISSGTLAGTEDTSSSSGLSLGAAINAALSINSDGTGTMGPNTVLVTNGTEIYFINEANGAPAEVQVFQQ